MTVGSGNQPKPDKQAAKAARAAKLAAVMPWDRRRGEDDEKFAWFLAYLNIVPHERSVTKAYRSYTRQEVKDSKIKIPEASRFWWYAATMNCWKERAQAYDVWLLQKEREAWERRRLQFVARKGDAAFKALDRAMEMLDANAPKNVKLIRLPDGTMKQQVVPDGYSFDDAAKLLTAAVRVGNDALGLAPLADQVIQQDGRTAGGGKSRIAISQELLAEITAETPEPESTAAELRQQYEGDGQ